VKTGQKRRHSGSSDGSGSFGRSGSRSVSGTGSKTNSAPSLELRGNVTHKSNDVFQKM